MSSHDSVLITGGAGFIGSHLAEALLSDGKQVTVLDDLSTGNLRNIRHLIDRPGFQFQLGSVLDSGLCDRMIANNGLVLHLAAAVGVKLVVERPAETIERNVRGTENVLECALRHGRKIFLASTSEVYGKEPRNDTNRFRESDDITLGPSMRWSYACSKAIDEYLARAYFLSQGLPIVIGRFFNIVGPRQSGAYGMVVPRFVEWALRGEPIQVYGDGQQVRTFAHVSDAVRAARSLIADRRAEGGVFNIGSGEPITILELAHRVKEMTQSSSQVVFVPYEHAYKAGFEDIRSRVPDLTRITQLVGYQPEWRLEQVLEDVIQHTRRHLVENSSFSGAVAGAP